MYLLTGRPNTGKSTAIKTLISLLGKKRCAGFYTSEILEGKKRVGFKIHTLSDKEFVFAHIDLDKTYAIEEFGVDISAFERYALPELYGTNSEFVIIDEIGPMQLYSESFKKILSDLNSSSKKVIATICKEDDDFTKELKNRNSDTLFELNEENRDEMPFILAEKINEDDPLYLSKLELSKKYHKEVERFSYNPGGRILLRSDHDIRIIERQDEEYSCTCDYFKEKGTCSHIMAVIRNKIFWKY